MLLIGNGRLITRDEKNTFFDNGAVLIDGKVIQKVGTTQELKMEYPDAEYIDAKGGVIMPALINTHEHIYSAMARGLSINGYNPDGFLDILDGMWWTIDRHLTLEQVKQSAMATYIDCIKNGVTTVFDHHASYGSIKDSLFTIQDAARELGVRTCLCYEVSDRDGTEKMREGVQENAAFIRAALAEEDDPQRLQDYVRGMSELTASRSSYNTNNLISDAILNRYGRLCEKEEIRIGGTGKFPDQISVTDTDLCVILSNAMKNAYEAAIQCEKGEISFEVKSTGSFINLVIRNSAKDQPELEEGYLITTKKDKKNHGIGTRNMVETARKNGGDVTWDWDEGGYVTANIILPGSPHS